MASSNGQGLSDEGKKRRTADVFEGDGAAIRVDPYGNGLLSERAAQPPADAVIQVVADVNDQGVVTFRETYSLQPGADGKDRYRLWASHQLSQEGNAWVAAEWTGLATTATEAAEALLVALWRSRSGFMALVNFIEKSGSLSLEALERISRAANGLDIPPNTVDVADGVGTIRRADGSVKYRGELNGGVPHGRGAALWENGAVACEGEFKLGSPQGQVKIYFRDGVLSYQGNCEDGYPFGDGTEYHKNGRVRFEGIFGRQFPPRYGYGARNYVRGRLYRETGELVHDGKFESVGNGHSRPKGAPGGGTTEPAEIDPGQCTPAVERQGDDRENAVSSGSSSWYYVTGDICYWEVGSMLPVPGSVATDSEEKASEAYERIEKACEEMMAERDRCNKLIAEDEDSEYEEAEYWWYVYLFEFPRAEFPEEDIEAVVSLIEKRGGNAVEDLQSYVVRSVDDTENGYQDILEMLGLA